MNFLLGLGIALLISSGLADNIGKEWTKEEIDAIFAHASSDATATTPVTVANHNYSSETYHVTTADGYILEMHRIPGSPICPPANGKPVAFLMHGLLCSSADWVVQGPEKSLPYIMADAGYDVWMGNARGNTYSRKHTPTVSRKQFWDFSWSEIGRYDLPVMIDYALKKTGQTQVVYIGHSQGTTSFYVMTSTRPEYNKRIKAMFSLSPIAYVGHIFNPLLRALSIEIKSLKKVADLIGLYEFSPSPRFVRIARAALCANDFLAQFVCQNILFILGGFDRYQLDLHLLPTIFGHFPAGSSVRQLIHYGQEVQSRKFRQYDYGEYENIRRYGSATPPNYNLSLISAPVHLVYSHHDWLSAGEDVTQLYHELGNPIEMVRVPNAKWTHFDYIYGMDAKSLVYEPIMNTLKKSYGLPSSCLRDSRGHLFRLNSHKSRDD